MITLKITKEAYLKLRCFTELCDTEISGLGKVKENGDSEFEIYDIELFEQNASFGHSDLDEEKLAKFLNEKIIKKENIKDYKVWWHSHADMKAYFSPRDDRTIDESTEFPYLISIVTNKKGEDLIRLDLYKPLRLTIPLKMELTVELDEQLKLKCQKEIKEKVKKRWSISIFGDKKIFSIPRYSKKL
ncbi:MAG: Mov34/MPN/PAD-1 family protein [Methanogenium sp.]|jgi:hypothetical protein